MRETQEVRDKVVLVGLNSPVLKREENADEGSMEELAALVETAGGETVGTVLQNRASPDPRTFVGEGKVAEIQLFCENVGATMVIFDNDLSPSQQRVLTDLLGVQVLDRCGLILDIFAQRARTREGRLQVELAQYQYLLPRLTGMWTHLERQGGTSGQGAIGSKGPGETQLETDRRLIHKKIDKVRRDLEEVRRLWIYGTNVEMTRLKFDRGHTYEDLAAYLTKEPREWGHPQVGERTWTPSLGLDRPEPQTERVPDCVTLAAPPEAEVLANEGPVRNGYGEFAWIKYMLPKSDIERRPRARRRRKKE